MKYRVLESEGRFYPQAFTALFIDGKQQWLFVHKNGDRRWVHQYDFLTFPDSKMTFNDVESATDSIKDCNDWAKWKTNLLSPTPSKVKVHEINL